MPLPLLYSHTVPQFHPAFEWLREQEPYTLHLQEDYLSKQAYRWNPVPKAGDSDCRSAAMPPRRI